MEPCAVCYCLIDPDRDALSCDRCGEVFCEMCEEELDEVCIQCDQRLIDVMCRRCGIIMDSYRKCVRCENLCCEECGDSTQENGVRCEQCICNYCV